MTWLDLLSISSPPPLFFFFFFGFPHFFFPSSSLFALILSLHSLSFSHSLPPIHLAPGTSPYFIFSKLRATRVLEVNSVGSFLSILTMASFKVGAQHFRLTTVFSFLFF